MKLGLLILATILLAGHASLWIPVWNRVESTAMPRWIKSRISRFAKLACVGLPPMMALGMAIQIRHPWAVACAQVYCVLCAIVAFLVFPSGLVRRFSRNVENRVRGFESQLIRVPKAREEGLARATRRNRMLFAVPGNQSFEFEHNVKHVEIERLRPELDGMSIAHISDLHFTGAVGKSYFDQAVECVNDMQADIIAVTGDLLDDPLYMDWIPSTLGRLRAKHGVYVVFGNHDCKHNLSTIRSTLTRLGLFSLGGRYKEITIRGQSVVLAGNELPWVTPPTDMTLKPRVDSQLRILLAHSPDQLEWARFYDFDVMLAGHTHGGQFRIPWFGAVVCPTTRPLAFASGTFYESPTLLHVSRGLSGELPLRLNCRPEITELVLSSPELIQQEHRHQEEIKELFGLRSKVDQLIEEDGVTRTNSLGELAAGEITLRPKPADSELVSTAGKD